MQFTTMESGNSGRQDIYFDNPIIVDSSNFAYWRQSVQAIAASGRIEVAKHIYQQLIELAPEDFTIELELASLLANSGDVEHARYLYISLFQRHADKAAGWIKEATAAAKQVLLTSAPLERLVELGRPCPILGGLDEATLDRTIHSILEARHDEWQADRRKPPANSEMYRSSKTSIADFSKTKVMMVFPQYQYCLAGYAQNGVSHHLSETAKRVGLQAEFFGCDDFSNERLTPIDPEKARIRIAEFEAAIDRMRPDVMFFSINYMSIVEHSLTPEMLDGLRIKYGFRLVGVAFDCLPPWGNVGTWTPKCDMVMLFENARFLANWRDQQKVKVAVTVPHDRDLYKPRENKDIYFMFRGREAWSLDRLLYMLAGTEELRKTNLSCHIVIHDHSPEQSVSMEDFGTLFSRSKVSFCDGRREHLWAAKPGRFFEAVWSKCLVIQEAGPDFPRYFVPFIHYIPVTGPSQFQAYLSFFTRHEEWRQRITQAAYDWASERYSSDLFWKWTMAQLYPA